MSILTNTLTRNEVTAKFKNLIGCDFEVNETTIPDYKKNYFRLYIDGNKNKYVELLFSPNGELARFGYRHSLTVGNIERNLYGSYAVLTRISPAIKAFLNSVANDIENGGDVGDNANRLRDFIAKNI